MLGFLITLHRNILDSLKKVKAKILEIINKGSLYLIQIILKIPRQDFDTTADTTHIDVVILGVYFRLANRVIFINRDR